MGSDGGTVRASGLTTALDTIIAPKEAFERLRTAPTWGWALLLVIACYALASYLMTPALMHGFQADWPRQVAANPQLAQGTPEEQRRYLEISLKFVQFSWTFAPITAVLSILVQSLLMLIFKAVGRGDTRFATLWSAATNIQVPALGLAALVTAVIVMLRGPDAFNSIAEVQGAMPSLGLFVDPSATKLHAFLLVFNPFTLWGCGLTILAMIVAARVGRVWAWATGVAWLLAAALLVAMVAR